MSGSQEAIPPETTLVAPFTLRLIPSAFFKGPILRPLVDDEEELRALEALERSTSKRLSQRRINPDFEDWGSSCVEAAFAYRREGGNRFNSIAHGAWYCAFDEKTALAEVGYHKSRELGYLRDPARRWRDETSYHGLQASFIGRFHDVRGAAPASPWLDPDPAVAYPAGQALARQLLGLGSRGLVYPSVRHAGGTCLVAFQEIVVQDVRPGARWRLRWTGTPEYEAEAV